MTPFHTTRKANIWPIIVVGSSKSRSKFLNVNVSGTKRDGVPKQRYDRFSYLETKSMPLLLLSMSGQPQDILLHEVLRNPRSRIDF